MWVVGDWGQDLPWSRATGVKMVKGEDDVYTGELSLPNGTNFDIKILKSTVSTTSGGDNAWSAVRYASTLNMPTSHDFGEFTDNLIPDGNFEEGQVEWAPAECMTPVGKPFDGGNVLGPEYPISCSSAVFVLPPNQILRLTGYIRAFQSDIDGAVAVKVVTPQQQTLFEFSVAGDIAADTCRQFSGTFKTADVPMECRIVLSDGHISQSGTRRAGFDSLSLVSP